MENSAAPFGKPGRLSNKARTDSAFVLVEVLVVSVIVAILAAVAIPVYSGYVQGQRVQSATSVAQSAAAAANIFTRRTGAAPVCSRSTSPDCVALLNIFLTNPAQYYIDISGRTVTVTDRIHSGITPSVTF